ncbi:MULTISPECIES: hypothetical protein [Bradyrhizobium]|jgi:hypothetical protein|uniref:NodB homology domain-containing protein n=1 Tax=Bradyrhizobium diazoefficiens TaxID=1355477 RepID=A0A810D3P3_9BRAD|nr:hypothetical protein [Bradyrhizobium diazoefficiens]AWO93181.1 hypothetical protein DI395_34940 [Bradyrhizobium diazoefficiens]WLA76428.1 hypothetical protein QIH77_14950 [Bradyrhizobium diazoefficiens]BCE24251.1 hypothetical protein XF1B_69320 [Bradyrhizobium diazoefficiens]BCE50508.1 hypothetical protein XF4B_68570 [Bradyrhizobium diazoefficiens]BCE94011.1 hypothetical protein XF10B_68090 [Bradyrhizobium diazoefficiens]
MDTGSSIALLLRSDVPSSDDCNLAEMLEFFGIPWKALTVSEANGGYVASLTASHPRFSILTSAACLAETMQPRRAGTLPDWLAAAASVFVYGFLAADSCRALLRQITGDPQADIRGIDAWPMTVSVTDAFPDMCGPMSALRIQLEPGAADAALVIRDDGELQSILGAPEGHLFAGFSYSGVRFFADASLAMVDIRERAATYFDVKKRFAGAVPVVMYLKWSFRNVCWNASETNACLIIDDPPLWPRYGLLDFGELLHLANERTLATTVAFIPWNWQRTNRDTVAAFRQNREKLSVCVHGCDHTRGEFAARSAELLDRKLKTARSRMQSLLNKTALDHENVMVFPQGAFSPEAVSALKRNGFVAAVNTEVAPSDDASNETTLADLWSVAIVRYGGFSIYTRRYIAHGIENFAFDGILGKPCFVAGHHDIFRDHGSELAEFLQQLASLRWKLCWRTLGNAVFRSYSIRPDGGTIMVKMFAEQVRIENVEAMTRRIRVVKQESQIASLKNVTVNQEVVAHEYIDGCLRVIVDITPGRTADIRCVYHELPDAFPDSESVSYRLGVAVRRYLSELRDNYGHIFRFRV